MYVKKHFWNFPNGGFCFKPENGLRMQNKGILDVFFCQNGNNFLTTFAGIFFTGSNTIIFWGIPKTNFRPNGQVVVKLWPFQAPKKAYFGRFSGKKWNYFLTTFDGIFLQELIKLFLGGTPMKFQPKQMFGFQIVAIASGWKGMFLMLLMG